MRQLDLTHDYVRHGTTTLFAALEVATGKVLDACYPRNRHEEFLNSFARSRRPTRASNCTSCDNYATHKHPDVNRWLARKKRVTLHFTPTSGSWLNMVEIFFGIITRQAIRRGTFTSVKDLIAAIEIFIDGWNERCQPFIWTKTADQILPHATGGQRSSACGHVAAGVHGSPDGCTSRQVSRPHLLIVSLFEAPSGHGARALANALS